MRNSYQSQSLVHEACMRNQSLFCKKENVNLSEKKLTQHVSKDFPSSTNKEMGK